MSSWLPASWLRLALPALLCLRSLAAAPTGPVPLWPGEPPWPEGTQKPAPAEERDLSKPNEGLVAGRPLIRLGHVHVPTLEVRRPPADRDTGASVVVCPGGGYYILAMDLEGTEVCDWLNSIGVTGILLKYRVPRAGGPDRHPPALQDVQRAIGLARSNAKDWGLDPARIGVMGFSAGGHLAAAASTLHATRTYARVDAADDASCRPDFTLLVYPAYLAAKGTATMSDELPVKANTPPAFVVMAQDDGVGVGNAMAYASALMAAKVPCELHVYPVGGHGYGLRRTELPVTRWPERAADWMRERGWLKR